MTKVLDFKTHLTIVCMEKSFKGHNKDKQLYLLYKTNRTYNLDLLFIKIVIYNSWKMCFKKVYR